MYDLDSDKLEVVNLGWSGATRTPEQEKEYRRLKKKLAKVVATRLQPLKGRQVTLDLTCETAWVSSKQGQVRARWVVGVGVGR